MEDTGHMTQQWNGEYRQETFQCAACFNPLKSADQIGFYRGWSGEYPYDACNFI